MEVEQHFLWWGVFGTCGSNLRNEYQVGLQEKKKKNYWNIIELFVFYPFWSYTLILEELFFLSFILSVNVRKKKASLNVFPSVPSHAFLCYLYLGLQWYLYNSKTIFLNSSIWIFFYNFFFHFLVAPMDTFVFICYSVFPIITFVICVIVAIYADISFVANVTTHILLKYWHFHCYWYVSFVQDTLKSCDLEFSSQTFNTSFFFLPWDLINMSLI